MLAAGTVAAIPAVAETARGSAHPDAGLFALIERLRHLDNLMEDANAASDEASKRLKKPPVPEALEATGGAYKKWPLRAGETVADSVRGYFHGLSLLATYHGPEQLQAEMRQLADKYADEAIAAWDQWQADCRAAEECAGLPAAERRLHEVQSEWHEVARLIVSTRVRTIDGLLAKLACLEPFYDAREHDGSDGDDATADDILQSAIFDAKALMERSDPMSLAAKEDANG
jgi:hypothetical protein